MENIKRSSFRLFAAMLMMLIWSCKEENGFNEPVSADKTKPGVITNIKVENFNGGSYITYDLPKSENLLYVSAKYRINDKVVRETKASYYKDTIVVEGFAKAQEYSVTLHTVTRANVMSDPVEVKVHPLTPVYEYVQPSFKLGEDFGGINVQGLNPLKKEIGVILVAKDKSSGIMEVKDQFFTKDRSINYSVRGFESEANDFGVYITDRWGNISDTLKTNLTPLYEELADKSKFSVYNLTTDSPIGFGWVLPNLWNGNNDGDGWHTASGGHPPFVASFGIGKTYKLSRFMLWERAGQYTYGLGNPKEFSLWGSNSDRPGEAQLPLVAPEGTQIGDWTNLGNYKFPDPPSGNRPGSTNSADEAFVKAGVNFNVSFNAPSVKFLRVSVSTTWGNSDAAHIIEMSVYGRPE